MRRLQTTLFFIFVGLVAVSLIIFSGIMTNLANHKNADLAQESLAKKAQVAQVAYSGRLQQMVSTGLVIVKDPLIIEALSNNPDGLQISLMNLKDTLGIDFAMFVDENQNVLSRAHSEKNQDKITLQGMIERSLTQNIPLASTELLLRRDLLEEGEAYADLAKIRRIPSLDQQLSSQTYETKGLAQIVVLPVSQNNEIKGALVLVDLLNRDYTFPRFMHTTLNATVTIYQQDIAVSTNLRTAKGTPFIGTILPRGIYMNLTKGQVVESIWQAKGFKRTAFLPLKNYQGRIVGALSVGVDENKFTQSFFAGSSFAALLFTTAFVILLIGGIFSYKFSRDLLRPLKHLERSIRKADRGKLNQGTPLEGFEEFVQLGKRYNMMIRRLRRRIHKK